MEIKKYFEDLEKNSKKLYDLATEARKKRYDPDEKVEITLAKNMAERVIGIIAVVAPQIQNSGATQRIIELEKKYGILDWRVSFIIAKEIAQEKFCKFKDVKEAIEVGIRTGFAYVTVGVVSSPLEGFTDLELKQRRDNTGEYFCLNYSGPIRNAGGTAAAVSVLIADYVRKQLGYKEYDPTKEEIKRCFVELENYHEKVTNLQYFPSQKETEFLMQNLPVEISGDESEKWDVSMYKDLPRIKQNKLRSGYCLIHSSCIPLKAPKLWKQISKWGEEFEMEHWNFLEKFIKIQKTIQNKDSELKELKNKAKITPNYTFIKDLVAGRPVLGYPMRPGSFRLRFGRSRLSGFSAQSINPSTMHILDNFIATGTQLKVERPGKATAVTVCDSIDGPIVKLIDGSVIYLEDEKTAKEYKKKIKEILFLGDILVNYGDFLDRAHTLFPPGYCQEWWILEFEKAVVELFGTIDYEKISEVTNIQKESIKKLFLKPLRTKISPHAAIKISQVFKIPLHPQYTYFWNLITLEELKELIIEVSKAKVKTKNNEKIVLEKNCKKILEKIGLPHLFIQNENIVIEKETFPLLVTLGLYNLKQEDVIQKIDNYTNLQKNNSEEKITTIEMINQISPVKIKDKAGIFVGARMGRPEKSKMRKLKGSPHVLFPVGEQGGRMRSFQAALEKGFIEAEFAQFKDENRNTVYGRSEITDKKTKRIYFTKEGKESFEKEDKIYGKNYLAKKTKLDIKEHFNALLKKLNTKIYPDLIKGVKGTSNSEHLPEHLIKGILRAKHEIYVNRDGTTRYDCSEIPITHFKPSEINVDVKNLKKLGYDTDRFGRDLINENQVLELKPQDIIIPCSPNSPDEKADEVLFRTTKFIDEMLIKLYGLKPFYNLKEPHDLVGQLIIGLAPHTSAGILGRIIGFSKTQGLYAHPLFHAAMRRDCDGDEACVLLLLDAFLNFSKKYLPARRGSTMDAPLVLTSLLNPAEVDDMIFNMDIVSKYPLSFYTACEEYKMPWDVKIEVMGNNLGKLKQYEGYSYTHPTRDINQGVLVSSYKILPSMAEKLEGQMKLAEKIRAVDMEDVAKMVIEKHFIRDIRGNLRKFSTQQFRCVGCNTKFRRPPLIGKCTECGGKIIFTISEGFIMKYLEPSIVLANKYAVDPYLQKSLELTKNMVEELFGKETEKQTGLSEWT